MADHARSSDPAVQAQLDRLTALGPGADVLGLDRITRLLARLGDPHHTLPPVFHVAGTNGKGSTCAFLRTALEAAGHRVHVYTSPHLVRFNERIRVAGRLIEDAALGPLLAEVLDRGGDIGASFFEVTTAAAFLAFARTPADTCVIEVGLGGRLDATNVIQAPLVTGIARLGIDHQAFLGDTLAAIAYEKAGIAKPGVPLVTLDQPPDLETVIADVARAAGAPMFRRGVEWRSRSNAGAFFYRDPHLRLVQPLPVMAGAHQHENLALAIAMLSHQHRLRVPPPALARAARETRWPARLQRLTAGPLVNRLPPGSSVWIDGAHNLSAADVVAQHLAHVPAVELVVGMLANKDAHGLLATLAPYAARIHAVPVPDHACHAPEALAAVARSLGSEARAHADLGSALDAIGADGRRADVLVVGSLYLAGQALSMNDEAPR